MTMKCPKCDADIPSDSEYCPKCGVKLGDETTVVFVPLDDRAEHPLPPTEAEHVHGFEGHALVVEHGPRAGLSFVLDHDVITVGRHPDSDIFLDDVTVSRHHCRLLVDGERVMVEDSGSTNGTYVNGERMDRAELQAGDEILVGRFDFVLAHGDG